jgi:hypothetical protein
LKLFEGGYGVDRDGLYATWKAYCQLVGLSSASTVTGRTRNNSVFSVFWAISSAKEGDFLDNIESLFQAIQQLALQRSKYLVELNWC